MADRTGRSRENAASSSQPEYQARMARQAMRTAGATEMDVANFERTCEWYRHRARQGLVAWPFLVTAVASAVLVITSPRPTWLEYVMLSLIFVEFFLFVYIVRRARARARGRMALLVRDALWESMNLLGDGGRNWWATETVSRSLRRAAQIADQQLAKTLHLGRPIGREQGTAAAIAAHLRHLADRVVGPDMVSAAEVSADIATFAPYLNGPATWLNFPNDNNTTTPSRTAWTIVRNIAASILVVGAVAVPLIPQVRGWAPVGSAALLLLAAIVLGNGTGLLTDVVRSRIEKG